MVMAKDKEQFKRIARKIEEESEKVKNIDIVQLTFKNKPRSAKYEKAYLPEEIAVENFA